MQPQTDHLRPPADPTPTPDAVVRQVQTLQGEGKQVVKKMARAEYNKLMSLPHEDRLAYALKVMRLQEKHTLAKARVTDELKARRTKRSGSAKRKRTQRRKSGR